MSESLTQHCGACLAEIPAGAIRCQHCGSDPRGPIDWRGVTGAGRWLAGFIALWILGVILGGTAQTFIGGIGAFGTIATAAVIVWELFHLKRRTVRPPAAAEQTPGDA